jgi:hypothetical protein
MGAHPRHAASLPVASLPRSTVYRGCHWLAGFFFLTGCFMLVGMALCRLPQPGGAVAGAVIGWAYGGFQGTPQGPGAGRKGHPWHRHHHRKPP